MTQQRLVETRRARDRQRRQRRAIEQRKLEQLVAGQRLRALLLELGEQQIEGDPVGLALGAKAAGREVRRVDRAFWDGGREHQLPARLMPKTALTATPPTPS